MTAIVKRSQRKYTPEQKKQLAEMAATVSKQLEPALESVRKTAEAYTEQSKAINRSLAEVTKSVKMPALIFDIPVIDTTALDNSREIYAEAVKQTEQFTKSFQPMFENFERMKADLNKSMPVLPDLSKIISSSTTISPEFFNVGEVRRVKAEPHIDWTLTEEIYQKPMHPSDAARFERIEVKLEALESKPKLEEHSIYNRKIMALDIDGKVIKLTAIEKNICNYVFWDRSVKAFDLEEVENAVYEDIASASEKLKQALKRINIKVKKVQGSNLFSYSEGVLTVLI